jgi:hypothetical protein
MPWALRDIAGSIKTVDIADIVGIDDVVDITLELA